MQATAAFFATPSISRRPIPYRCVRAQRNSVAADLSTLPDASSSSSRAIPSVKWAQKTVVIPPQRRGCHIVTSKIVKEIEQDLSGFKCGLAHLFLHHTSASLTINENCDSDVRHDTETFLNKVVPEGWSAPWKHTLEGPDDMPAHIKSSMFGCALTIPITNGRLNMGTWQGNFFISAICMHQTAESFKQMAFGCASIATMEHLDKL